MAGVKTTPNDEDVNAFIESVSDPHKREDAKALKALMEKVTRRPARMWGSSIVGFGSYHYRYASGREGDWMLTGFSPRKRAISIYVMSGFDRHADLLARLGKYKSGRSCLYVNRLADVDIEVLGRLLRASVAHLRKNQATG